MGLNELKQQAYEANLQIVKHSLVVLTWGNASVLDADAGIFAIKPSGVVYDTMRWEDMVLVDLSGKIIDSGLAPSSDTATHLEIYKGFSDVRGIVHTHSAWATMWAQAGMPIPILGTTHADYFKTDIPCIPVLEVEKVENEYEKMTGLHIVNEFNSRKIDPFETPACLLSNHAPFTWGRSIQQAVDNAVALEQCAMMAYYTLKLNEKAVLPEHLLKKHYERKHGSKAYYGQ